MSMNISDDQLLLKTLEKNLSELKENYEYVKAYGSYDSEILEEIKESALILEDIIPQITGVESLDELSDEDYWFVFTTLEACLEVFIVDHRVPQLQKEQEAEFERLYSLVEEIAETLDFGEDDE